jgi:hypothetical protein
MVNEHKSAPPNPHQSSNVTKDHPIENLIRFGYKLNMKFFKCNDLLYFWLTIRTYCWKFGNFALKSSKFGSIFHKKFLRAIINFSSQNFRE